MSSAPRRLRWHRFMGTPLPPHSRSVQRPSDFGNPFVVYRTGPSGWFVMLAGKNIEDVTSGLFRTRDEALIECLSQFREYAEKKLEDSPSWLTPLKGLDLACACKLDQPCHANILLELANR